MLLQSYLATLIPALAEGSEGLHQEALEVSKLLGMLQGELARGNGMAVASVVSSRRHLWLSQSKLPTPVQKTFLDLPYSPGLTFGPGVGTILEQTVKLRKDRETLQQFMATTRSRPARSSTSAPASQQRSGNPPQVQPTVTFQGFGGRGKGGQRGRQQRKGPSRGRGKSAAAKAAPAQQSS